MWKKAPSLFKLTLYVTLTLGELIAQVVSQEHVVEKDVAIVGGGAAGTYAAVRLSQELNASIVLIEQQSRLGGHVETYIVPETNTTLEYGVQSYVQYGPTVAFFQRFGVDITTFTSRRLTSVNVDIETGKILSGYIPPTSNATTEAFRKWLEIVEKYDGLFEPGYWDFPLPDAIPEDLLSPFGEFARRQGIVDAVPRIMAISNVGVGGLEETLTMYVIQSFAGSITKGVLNGTLFQPVGSNSLLYERVYELLKHNVLLESRVVEAQRSDEGIELMVRTQDNEKTLVKAKKVLFTGAPGLANLQGFGLDEKEKDVLGKLQSTWSFAGVAKIPCIPENYSISYIPSTVIPSNHLAVRDYSYTLRFDSTGPSGLGLFRVLLASNYSLTHAGAKQLATENVQKLVSTRSVNYTGDCVPEYKAFVDHNSVIWPSDAGDIEDGFVQNLYALQGHRSTWWVGEIWGAHYTSGVWAFVDTVLERGFYGRAY
jgi:hypothetical protein